MALTDVLQTMLKRLLLSICGLLALQAQAQVRMLDDADVVETPAHYDLTIRFSCDVRYLASAPVDEGVELRVRLVAGATCPRVQATESLVTPAPAVVRNIELSSSIAGEVELLIRWRLTQRFVLVPTNDRQGLRIRILRAGETQDERTRVLVEDMRSGDVVTAYAINLDSSLAPIDDAAVQRAQTLLRNRIYRSEADVGDVHWYRLRLGPISTRAEAERLLLTVQNSYPRAWLAIADEQIDEPASQDEIAGDVDTSLDAADSKINDTEADTLWSQANERFRKRDYAQAIALLTKLKARPSGKYGIPAQELLGIAHERRGELALAQAEYESFLRAFPRDRRASRVRRRMNALRTASLPGRKANGGDDNAEGVWHWNGGVSQYYRRDSNHLSVDNLTQNSIGQNALLNDVDVSGRYRGISTDTRVRISAGYNKSFLPQPASTSFNSARSADQAHVSSAFVEWADRDRRWYASAGRQNRSSSGSYGTFDGAFGSYQWLPHLTTDLTVGMPVDSSRSGVNTKRLFQSLALEFGTFASAWEPSLYVTHQTLEGQVDREAVGAEVRYFKPGRVFIGFVDYDVYFKQLNSAVLVGTLQLPARWTLSIDAERRKSPLVTTRNALIGQPTTSLVGLSSAFSDEQIKQLALDRTPDTTVVGLTAMHPLGERLQFSLTAQSIKSGATPSSDASDVDPAFVQVEGTTAVGPEMVWSAQLLAASIMRAGDINIIGLRRQTGGQFDITSLGLSSRVPLWRDFRFGPQLQVDRRQFQSDNSVMWLYSPSLRLTMQRPTLQIDIEAGGEISRHQTDISKQSATRWFGYLGYRWLF